MTWSISASGPKADVLTKIAAHTCHCAPPETKAFECAKALCAAQVECLSTPNASVSASGHTGYCSVSVSGTT